MTRPSWDEYFLGMLEYASTRATCNRGRNACVIVRDKRVIVGGYVGSPTGLPHCDDVGHDLRTLRDSDGTERQHCVRTIHAEQNAICQAARFGTSLEGAILYTRMVPCRVCAMLIISVGIRRVVAQHHYQADEDTLRMFHQVGIELKVVDEGPAPAYTVSDWSDS